MQRRLAAMVVCAGPRLSVVPATVQARDTVRAVGDWFAADCYDAGQAGTPPPLTNLTIQVVQSGRTWTVASGVDAGGNNFSLDIPLRLPAELPPGPAQVAVDSSGSAADVRVTLTPR